MFNHPLYYSFNNFLDPILPLFLYLFEINIYAALLLIFEDLSAYLGEHRNEILLNELLQSHLALSSFKRELDSRGI